MRRYGILVLTIAVFLALTLASGRSTPRALADEGCGLHSLQGGYGFAFQGQVVPPTGAELDLAGAGRIVFDGKGGLSGMEWDSTNGVQETVTVTGSYSVQPDCTGTATLANSNGRTDHIRIGVTEGGQEFNFTVTDPGVVLTGQTSRQGISHCTDRSLSGIFNAAESGSDFNAAGVEQGDDSLFFTQNFDGHGKSTGTTTLSLNGFSYSDAFTGVYHINPDCTGTASNTFNLGGSDHVNIVLVEQGNEIKFISGDPGVVFAGTVHRMARGDN
jgi:hypothetical protein